MKFGRIYAPGGHDSKTVSMREFEVRPPAIDFIPKLPDAKASFEHISVMEKDNPCGTEFGIPGFEVVFHRFVRVKSVYVEKVDGSILEIVERLIERAANQCGERAITRIVVSSQIRQGFRVLVTGMLISLPGIDCITSRSGSERLHRLAESAVRIAVESA